VAKDAGKGRSLRYEASLHSAVVDRLRLRTDLEEAVADGSFVLNYQPIVELATSRTVGFEALVRWRHPVRGLLGPGEFIGLAEESGLIVPLGGWVLHHAIKEASQWQRWRPETYVSVNVSARQLRAPGFVEQVRTQLSASGLPPTNLTLEVTESLLANERGVGEALATLRADGVRVAIDDFGTGFSSLSYLRQLPVDVLKLDKSFVDTMTSSREQHAIMKTIIQLARTLDLEVVAEGVERLRGPRAPHRHGLRLRAGLPALAADGVQRRGAVAAQAGRRGGRHGTERGLMTSTRSRLDERLHQFEELRAETHMWDAVIDEVDGRRIRVGDHWLTDWASCNYLGFDLDAEIIEAVAATVGNGGPTRAGRACSAARGCTRRSRSSWPNCCTRRTPWCCRRSVRSTWP
jgi:EAL domain-containing protein (putative c-di-GMP-specific phosphodiesterase class I)